MTLLILSVGLPLAFQTALFRGLADLKQADFKLWPTAGVFMVAGMAFLTVSAAMVAANLIFLYGSFA